MSTKLLSFHSRYRGNEKRDLYLPSQKRARKDSFMYANGKGTDDGHRIMLLAMHYAPKATNLESDTNRINAFLDNGWMVCSVDLSGIENTYGHITANFKMERGVKGIIKNVNDNNEPAPHIIQLDYFRLQAPLYYRERYGEDWPEKSQTFFKEFESLIAIILPIDEHPQSSMEKQIKCINEPLNCFIIEKDDDILNPLVQYTKQSDTFFPERTHEGQKWRVRSFVVIHKLPKDEVEEYLKSRPQFRS